MLRFHVGNKRERQHFQHLSGPIEFGRGPAPEGEPRITRIIVQDPFVSKDHVRVEELSTGQVRVLNLSKRNSIRLADNSMIATGVSRDLPPPVRLTVGET